MLGGKRRRALSLYRKEVSGKSGVFGDEMLQYGFEHESAVGAAEYGLGASLRVGHHAEYVPPGVDDTGDVAGRTIRVAFRRFESRRIRIAKNDLAVGFELVQDFRRSVIIPFTVGDGNLNDLPLLHRTGKGRIGSLDAQMGLFAGETQGRIPHQRARKQAAFAEHLKPVADPDDEAPRFGKPDDILHHRREMSDGACT